MGTLLQDVRYAFRQLVRAPGFTAVAVLTLALGIGANTVMFGVVDALFLQPPPAVREPNRVVRLDVVRKTGNVITPEGGVGSYWDYRDIRAGVKAFSGVGAEFFPQEMSLGRGRDARQVTGLFVTGGYFPTLGTRPALGRFFGPAEDSIPGASPVAVLGYGFWQRHFGGDSAVVGREIFLKGHSLTVIGVAPEHFRGLGREPVDVWIPTAMMGEMGMGKEWLTSRLFIGLHLFARLAPGVSPERASADAASVLRHSAEGVKGLDPKPGVMASPLNAARGPHRTQPATLALWLALVTGIVLLIACANVANLLLARATRRRREIGVRIALGAGRMRLVRQLLTESVLLALLGGAAGLLLALWSSALIRLFPLPPLPSVINGRMLGFTLGISLFTGIVFGLLPALQASRLKLMATLRDGGERGGRSRSRTRVALLVAQLALSLVLLVGAGLLMRSLAAISSVDPGIDADRLLYLSADLEEAGYGTADRDALYDRMVERLRALPGVERVSIAQFAPMSGNGMSMDLRIPGRDSLPKAEQGPYVNWVDPGYFQAAGVLLNHGRGFTESDREASPPVAVVNEAMAQLYWPGAEAVGQCIQLPTDTEAETLPCTEVVGVARNAKHSSLREEAVPAFYLPLRQAGMRVPAFLSTRTILVRTRGKPGEMVESVRDALANLAPDLPFVRVTRAEDLLTPQLRPFRLGATLFSLFGLLALLLAAIGLYGVMAFTVAQRTREIGVRMALGAEGNDVLRMVILRAMGLALLGVGVGVVGALIVTRFMRGLLYGVGTFDPVTFAAVPLVLLAVALLASWLPARRATRVDPVVALRAE